MSEEKKRILLKIVLFIMIGGAVACICGMIVTLREYNNNEEEYTNLQDYIFIADIAMNDELNDAAGEAKESGTTGEDDIAGETKAGEIEETGENQKAVEEWEEKGLEQEKSLEIQVAFDMDFDSLKAINSDFIGWLIVDSLELSYPFVQDKGDDYYENYSFENEKNSAGAIFLDYQCKPNMKSFNSIIYGHNMRNGSMFGSLNEVLDNPEIIEENPYFYIFTEKEALMYKIVSGYYTDATSETYNISFDTTLDEMKNYVAYMESVSDYKDEEFFKEEVTEDLKLCTLSTCHGLRSKSRTVLHGKLVAREDRSV